MIVRTFFLTVSLITLAHAAPMIEATDALPQSRADVILQEVTHELNTPDGRLSFHEKNELKEILSSPHMSPEAKAASWNLLNQDYNTFERETHLISHTSPLPFEYTVEGKKLFLLAPHKNPSLPS